MSAWPSWMSTAWMSTASKPLAHASNPPPDSALDRDEHDGQCDRNQIAHRRAPQPQAQAITDRELRDHHRPGQRPAGYAGHHEAAHRQKDIGCQVVDELERRAL